MYWFTISTQVTKGAFKALNHRCDCGSSSTALQRVRLLACRGTGFRGTELSEMLKVGIELPIWALRTLPLKWTEMKPTVLATSWYFCGVWCFLWCPVLLRIASNSSLLLRVFDGSSRSFYSSLEPKVSYWRFLKLRYVIVLGTSARFVTTHGFLWSLWAPSGFGFVFVFFFSLLYESP